MTRDTFTHALRRRRDTTKAEKATIFGLGAATGAALLFFIDPIAGRRRRKLAADQAAGKARRSWRRGGRAGRDATAEAHGLAQRLRHRHEEPKDFDDVTLARKVETEIFRDAHVPKGRINVNAREGVIELRGELDSADLIEELVEKTRRVQGVRGVENLLHVPGTPAPMHQ
jgi:osmotically-inducible protein OsmY